MSDVYRDLELINNGAPWRHWEMQHFDSSEKNVAGQQPVDAPAGEALADTGMNEAPEPAATDDTETLLAKHRLTEEERLAARAQGYKEGFEQGRKEGYESGLAAGRKAAAKEKEKFRSDVLAPVKAIADEYGSALASLTEETAGELVELALAIGQSMARDCVEDDPRVITRIVQAILEGEFAPAARPQLLLNPADVDALTDALGDEMASQGWHLQPDEKITRGGCVLKNDLSEIDATWESRWRTISSRVRRRQTESNQDADAASTSGSAA